MVKVIRRWGKLSHGEAVTRTVSATEGFESKPKLHECVFPLALYVRVSLKRLVKLN